jgi:mono/diheme cytochrome c family protein
MSVWSRGLSWFAGAMLVVLALAYPAAALHGQQPSPAPPPAAATTTLEKGKQHFVTYTCYACHGYAGQGSDVGPRLDTDRMTLQAFTGYVRKPTRRMPPYRTERQISDAALAEIYAFLKSLPPPPDPKTIPLLRAD